MPYYDAAEVKAKAQDRWVEILTHFGIASDFLENVHGPCPGCNGKDRFRFDDTDGNGTFLCSQGGGGILSGDGFELLAHVKGWEWKRCLAEVAEFLSVAASPSTAPSAPAPPKVKPVKPSFKNEKLSAFAARWVAFVDTAWLADRSAIDPCGVRAGEFLASLFRGSEKVLVFTVFESQGQAIWPGDSVPPRGPNGIWFLPQPVDGLYHPNPRRKTAKHPGGQPSRRAQESVANWRYLVLESDNADPRDWLAALVQLPLAIAALYTSGGKSIHALVLVNTNSLENWRAFSAAIKPVMITLGADPQVASSAVRLTRLPGCLREGTTDKDGMYHSFEKPVLQKLLYLNPKPLAKPICALPRLRDVLAPVLEEADALLATSAADIATRSKAKDLGELITAMAAAAARPRDPVGCARRLAWFSSIPHVAAVLARLRRSPHFAQVA